ncbi:MAG: DUF1998 domain-containing protein [Polyangiaceae bacterium]
MADKPGGKHQHRPPDGRLRLSQLVTTFGPGSMVDLVHDAVLVGGLDYWRYDAKKPTPSLDEHRLRERVIPRVRGLGLNLTIDGAFRTGPAGKDDSAGPWNGIQVAEFPSWFVCQRCRALSHRKSLGDKKNDRYRHQCTRTTAGDCVPVRFVVTCNDGHLDEFPWNWFVHQAGERCDGKDLTLFEGATGDFTEIMVVCNGCKQRRSLADAREDAVLPDCKGRRPWLGHHADVPCLNKAHLLSRTASYAYFAQTESALSIPEKGRELQAAVASAKLWPMLEKAVDAASVGVLRKMIPLIDAALADITNKPPSDYSDDEVAAAVNAIHGGQAVKREGLRTAEFKQFLMARNEQPGEIPPASDSFFASRLVPNKPLPDCLADVTLVKKLRRVSAQVGFTRLTSPMSNLQGEYDDKVQLSALTLAENWLPATEILGEGVLLRFREDVMRKWEEQDAVIQRATALFDGFTKKFGGKTPELFPGARFFMLHSLSHLLMTAMSLECGYSAASLGERIYCAPATDPTPMAAILILTGSSGAEGTLGGLIEQGRRITHHLRRAFTMAALCSNDPVCGTHRPGADDHSERFLEGAACHGCLYVAEPSCERFNGYLDRALVVPTIGQDPALAFFGKCP